ncbi:AI-2E family transporter [Clostridium sp. SHJSY1]|uniref:AI-2E family transporter n=1 Tax=Clostridium sp. SHJSY1 TaxID=2942483 RepID=UPI002876D4F5|nr:AI-2E family transporter [Clostridium sp. SHJSY1]MDS0525380.1 AI-2E family transporter [Clostridium sp. SHJSY1]
MLKKRVIINLIIANLILIFLYMLGKFQVFHEFIQVAIWVIFTPIIFGVFLFYILKPLNNIFLRKRLKSSISASITVLIAISLLAIIITYFGKYLVEQIIILKDIVLMNIQDKNLMEMAQDYLKDSSIKNFVENISSQLMNYVNFVFANLKEIFDMGMMLFSNILLIILITFFLLRDGSKFKSIVLKYIPKRYKEVSNEILSEGDIVLSSYIIGQATVAISLAAMVFTGYEVIGMPSALLLASTTFILAFIPFVGFFISMIIPYIIAAAVGTHMLVRLTLLFIIAQTLKGRVVVPFIMGRAMKIHPITDIFLVVGASTIGGPLAAFCVVPIYSLLKLTYKKLVENGFLTDPSNID